MGFLDLFKSKKRPPVSEPVPAAGWDAIIAAFAELYPGQDEPYHRAPDVLPMHDLSANRAAFDGVSVYDGGEFWHFVTFGLSDIYDQGGGDPETSGFGYELTFKLPKMSAEPPAWAFSLLDALGKQVWNGMQFGPGHTIKTGAIDGRGETVQTSVLVVRDPAFADGVDTPNGHLQFLLLVGVEDELRQRVLAAHQAAGGVPGWEQPTVAGLQAGNQALVTPVRTQGAWG